MPAKRIIAAATRFQEAWDKDDGRPLSEADIAELHGAALGLIAATGTSTLQEALDVVNHYDA